MIILLAYEMNKKYNEIDSKSFDQMNQEGLFS